MTNEKVILTPEQAMAMLPGGEDIHTFLSPAGGILIGADWRRSDVESSIQKYTCEMAGEQATAMGHGLVVHIPNGPLFVATI